MKEKTLHPIVRDFLLNEKKCIAAEIGAGHKYIGYADAFGIRDVGGIYGSEVIGYAVEVKLWKGPYGKHIGQALGYSLFSHRCYLAVPDYDPFVEEDIEMAMRFGIGLIEINPQKKRCREVLSASHHEPITSLFESVLDWMGYFQCSICRELVDHSVGWSRKMPSKVPEGRIYYSRINKERVFYTNAKSVGRIPLLICPDCLKRLEYK